MVMSHGLKNRWHLLWEIYTGYWLILTTKYQKCWKVFHFVTSPYNCYFHQFSLAMFSNQWWIWYALENTLHIRNLHKADVLFLFFSVWIGYTQFYIHTSGLFNQVEAQHQMWKVFQIWQTFQIWWYRMLTKQPCPLEEPGVLTGQVHTHPMSWTGEWVGAPITQ